MEKIYGDEQIIVMRNVGLVAIQRMVFSRKSRRNIIMYRTPDAAKVEARKIVSCLKDRAATTMEATHQIVSNTSVGINAAVSGQLPTVVNLKQTIRRVRHQVEAPLPNVTNLKKLTLLSILQC